MVPGLCVCFLFFLRRAKEDMVVGQNSGRSERSHVSSNTLKVCEFEGVGLKALGSLKVLEFIYFVHLKLF